MNTLLFYATLYALLATVVTVATLIELLIDKLNGENDEHV